MNLEFILFFNFCEIKSKFFRSNIGIILLTTTKHISHQEAISMAIGITNNKTRNTKATNSNEHVRYVHHYLEYSNNSPEQGIKVLAITVG